MVKITENQRKYMVRRVNEEFDGAVSLIKQKEAVTIQKISEKAEKSYKKTLGIEKEVNNLKKYEKLYNEAKEKCNNVVTAMETHKETDSKLRNKYSFYGSCSIHQSSDMDKYVTMRCIDLALQNFGKPPEGAEMSKLERKRTQAVDYIYGMNESSVISQGLAKILKGTKIKLQIGGK